ncbi:L-serine ammonia-lyase [Leucobacter sp. GX24907]
MTLSVLDLFSIGIGPSSSHTVGPMRAARRFVAGVEQAGLLDRVGRVEAGLFGSLGATGIGHGSDTAVVVGLAGYDPESLDPDLVPELIARVKESRELALGGEQRVRFDYDADVKLDGRKWLPGHPNGMTLTVYDRTGGVLLSRDYYSIGGGFVLSAEELDTPPADHGVAEPLPFADADELLRHCREQGLSIAEVMLVNERVRRDESEVRDGLLQIWAVMQECVDNGCHRTERLLPGGLEVKRRAPELFRRLEAAAESDAGGLFAMDWVNLYALAVNEENASGGRVVTAPTNGAAGIIPAVLHYYARFIDDGTATDDRVFEFLLTAGAVGSLMKRNASISGAELGCQAEVGSACSMAAAGLCAVLGGSPEQVENAAEIGLEHNLGLTCDPVGGLVQVPCIERNAIASVKAINAARLAMAGDGSHRVTLDQAITTMRQTGEDMKTKYKETSLGGLAVNVIEC